MNKTYVITGASSGIGKALTEELCKDNMIFAGYRNEAKRAELERMSSNVYPFYVDYAVPETIKEASEYIKSKCKRIDTLVNIAGCVVAGPVENINMEEIRRQFNVNVFSHIEMTQHLVALLENGRIINISSMASFGIFPFISPYCASKRCLDMFFNSFLIENKRKIKVVSIKPGVISTPLWGKSVEENSKYESLRKGYEKEMEYIIKNAEANETCGLDVNEVVKVILKADSAKNPKLSYTVGGDAMFAKIVSGLPQDIINMLVKLGIKARMK